MADLQSTGPTFKSTFKTSQEKFISDLIQCKGARGWYIKKRQVNCGTQRCVSFNSLGHSKRVLTRSYYNLHTHASDLVNGFKQLSSNNASHSVSKIQCYTLITTGNESSTLLGLVQDYSTVDRRDFCARLIFRLSSFKRGIPDPFLTFLQGDTSGLRWRCRSVASRSTFLNTDGKRNFCP
jgi:hypothetical protein